MIKFYPRTATIKAEQFDGSDKMMAKYEIQWGINPKYDLVGRYYLKTLEGKLCLTIGDWIATGVDGERWPISGEIFKEKYKELPVIPDTVSAYITACKKIGVGVYGQKSLSAAIQWAFASGCGDWISQHPEDFARAWLDEYQIEREDK